MIYLAILTLAVIAFGAVAVTFGVKDARDGYEDEYGFHSVGAGRHMSDTAIVATRTSAAAANANSAARIIERGSVA